MDAQLRVLVTGGSGLVGTALQEIVKTRKSSGETWTFVGTEDADLRDFTQTARLFERFKPTHCLHLAAVVGGLFKNLNEKATMFSDNISINENVLKCSHSYKVQKLVSCLSTCIFPDVTTYPIDESMLHLGAPHSSNIGYAYAKRMIDVANRCYRQQFGSNFTSVIPTNIYGPNDNFNLRDGHVIPCLIHKCYQAKNQGKPFIVYGSGKPLRQFLYSKDLAELLVWALFDYEDVEPIIIAPDSKDEIAISDVANAIANSMGFVGEIKYDDSKADGQYKKTACNGKLRRLRPDFQFTSFSTGIQHTVDWFTDNYQTARK